ncbi:hypothetical protein MGG_16352 [Pyricularia oryzae 70-15]|uniref:Uncharacterized protein n=3 Tax=Pyricularia oryzae TaxID=318829 RepID=G4MLB8_PYRO7|nr:uncharacterized protein MGG_16352 [Pyricularia oryzae 70-15]EHA57648.1 hypothetical protein MGG_16352 [Pyricularia oryzae 70-15]ELQ43582.1 hypothetical protein OOU_Y34scaffold00141g5 [Pyricularia oryzae Y34]
MWLQEFKSDTESRRYVDLIQILALMLHRGYACSREQSLEKGRTRVSSARYEPSERRRIGRSFDRALQVNRQPMNAQTVAEAKELLEKSGVKF